MRSLNSNEGKGGLSLPQPAPIEGPPIGFGLQWEALGEHRRYGHAMPLWVGRGDAQAYSDAYSPRNFRQRLVDAGYSWTDRGGGSSLLPCFWGLERPSSIEDIRADIEALVAAVAELRARQARSREEREAEAKARLAEEAAPIRADCPGSLPRGAGNLGGTSGRPNTSPAERSGDAHLWSARRSSSPTRRPAGAERRSASTARPPRIFTRARKTKGSAAPRTTRASTSPRATRTVTRSGTASAGRRPRAGSATSSPSARSSRAARPPMRSASSGSSCLSFQPTCAAPASVRPSLVPRFSEPDDPSTERRSPHA